MNLSGSTNINIIQSGSYNELGATWVDNVDGTGDILASTSGSVNTFIVGVYILTYSHIDAAGNTGSVTRKVVVHVPDITNPEVSLIGPGNMIVYSDSIYTDPGASWADNIDGTGHTLVGIYGNTGSFQSTGTLIN